MDTTAVGEVARNQYSNRPSCVRNYYYRPILGGLFFLSKTRVSINDRYYITEVTRLGIYDNSSVRCIKRVGNYVFRNTTLSLLLYNRCLFSIHERDLLHIIYTYIYIYMYILLSLAKAEVQIYLPSYHVNIQFIH